MIAIILGGATGYSFGDRALCLKPFGTIFLNLIFTSIVPLIFFSVSSAIARVGTKRKLGKIFSSMAAVFISTGFIAASFTLLIVKRFPPAEGVSIQLPLSEQTTSPHFLDQLSGIVTVSDFSNLFSHQHMLALIVFSILVGLATTAVNPSQKTIFTEFLQAGEAIFMRVFSLIMLYAPIGFFAYFAVLVAELGPKLIESYVRVTIIYYVGGILYFIIAYTGYAYLASNQYGIRLFWRNVFLPVVTSLATCSSAACIPANLAATKAMRVPPEIYETAIPLGTILHKEGSIMGGMIKIAFLFGMFHLDFSSASVLLTAVGVSILVGTVMGAIPSGECWVNY